VQQIPVYRILTLLHGLDFIVNHLKSTITVVSLGLTTKAVNGYMEPTTEWCFQHLVQLINITLRTSPWTLYASPAMPSSCLGLWTGPSSWSPTCKTTTPGYLVMVVRQPEPAAETLATPSVNIGILWCHCSLHGMSWYNNKTVICYLLILRKLFAFQSW
jgi:hypothetical protein